ncbi:MAG: YecR family lipoprotein [bacterium]
MQIFLLRPIWIVLAVTGLFSGCTPYNLPVSIPTNKTAEVFGVDDTRGVVTMGAPYLYLEKPDVDWAQARIEAAEVCMQRRELANAEPVGNTRRECVSTAGNKCLKYALLGDYRCIP